MKTKTINKFFMLLAVFLGGANELVFAQNTGIDTATTEIKGYFDGVSNLILAIGAIVGLIGGVRVYIKWNNGDQDVTKAIMGWFGACLFLILVGVVIKAFFGI